MNTYELTRVLLRVTVSLLLRRKLEARSRSPGHLKSILGTSPAQSAQNLNSRWQSWDFIYVRTEILFAGVRNSVRPISLLRCRKNRIYEHNHTRDDLKWLISMQTVASAAGSSKYLFRDSGMPVRDVCFASRRTTGA